MKLAVKIPTIGDWLEARSEERAVEERQRKSGKFRGGADGGG